eukprot:CAMPEP_0172740852 /NCGR_PEP_ID=MMETSP1074-20121228/125753_1 /TAXON_ID=2916 /ORGANISM="Ceratium fusus, Strain PA161109" /LENGTH=90 /DNA_ID=CAMNT_0013571057 /DNA_START=66 /DNA_END=338 /DNA_ORIENTATION=+
MAQWEVTVIKKKGQNMLGLDTSTQANSTYLKVVVVKGEGLIAAWNGQNPTREVKVDDRIVKINGQSGGKEILYQLIRDNDELTLTMERGA